MRRGVNHLRGAYAARYADERGVVLVLAIIVMMALSIMLVTVISYSGSTSTATYVGDAKDGTNALAEAGINDAFSVIAASGTDTTAIKLHLPDYPGDPAST